MSKPVYEITEQLLSEIEADGGKNYNGLTLSLVAEIRRLQGKSETPAAPEKPAAKAVKLSPAQLKLAHMVDNAGTLRIANYGQQSRTAEAMRKKGLLEITEPDGIWGAYYGLTEAGYAALSNR